MIRIHRGQFLTIVKLLILITIVLTTEAKHDLSKYNYEQLDTLALYCFEKGDFQTALLYMQEGRDRALAEFGRQDTNYAYYTSNLAYFYKMIGEFELSESLSRESLGIIEQIRGKFNREYAIGLSNLATLYYSIRTKKGEAEKLFKECLAIKERVVGKMNYSYSVTLNNLGGLYESLGQYERAEPYLKETIVIRKELFGDQDPRYAMAVGNLGQVYCKMKQYNKAEQLHLHCLKIIRKTVSTEHPNFAKSLLDMAMVYHKLDKLNLAWDYILESIYVLSNYKMSRNISQAWVDSLSTAPYASDAQLEAMRGVLFLLNNFKTGHKEQDLAHRKLIIDLSINLFKRSKDDYSNDTDKLRMLSESHKWMLQAFHVFDPVDDIDRAFQFAELHKSVLLLEATKASKAYRMGNLPDSLIEQSKSLQNKSTALQAKLVKSKVEEAEHIRSELNAVNLQRKMLKDTIEKHYPNYAQFMFRTVEPKIMEVQEALDRQTALLEYVVGDSSLYIFCITRSKKSLVKVPLIKNKLLNHIKKLRGALGNFTAIGHANEQAFLNFTDQSLWCYQHLIVPIKEYLGGIENLVIVPDDQLGNLPFEVFLTKPALDQGVNYQNLDYIIKKYSVSYANSAKLWLENDTRAQRVNHNHQILAMAATYQSQLEGEQAHLLRWPMHRRLRSKLQPLPAARSEVEMLARQFKGYFGFDALATERFFKERAKNYGIIHLAMHGVLDHRSPMLSSLVFTENDDTTENNFLHAYEISRMQLNADLVVLSACETGYGKFEQGNGIASLARSFMYAGASSLVVSLWQVDDMVTSKIMQRFYTHLSEGLSKPQALRQAKLDHLKRADATLAHPAYWSSFIHIGNDAPIRITRTIKFATGWWVMSIFIALLLLGWIIWKKTMILNK